MKYIISLIIINVSIFFNTYAQDTASIFFEKGPNNMVRFYYDIDYYLVDKHCEFKFMERVAGFDIATNKFHGEFKDFDNNGRMVLSGNYNLGIKDGEFSAFYPDGTLKWKTTYQNNLPYGSIQYFYPDGKPMLYMHANNKTTYISQFWNKEGKQETKDGEGQIDITLPIVGFTEHGFTKYNTLGKISNGLPQGLWYTSFVTEAKKNNLVQLMISSYENGILREREIEYSFQNMLIDAKSLSHAPIEAFENAELLQSKKCSFDEHTGFNSFLSQKFKNFLNINNYTTDTDESLTITYTIRVSKIGSVYAPTITETSRELSKNEKHIFQNMLNQVYYYLPSYLNDKPINDQLTISLQIMTMGDLITILPAQITREKGF